MEMSVTINSDAFLKSVDRVRDRYDQALGVSKNMIASMLRTEIAAAIQNAGGFGSKFLAGLSVTVDGDTITTKIDAPGAGLFETGGVIHGHPLLWLPLSGTDAVGTPASSYGDQLFSVNRKTGGVPLLFSIQDHAPKYFGVPSVNISKKFHIAEIQQRVMANFPDIVEAALNG
jgi:hypothetical protein